MTALILAFTSALNGARASQSSKLTADVVARLEAIVAGVLLAVSPVINTHVAMDGKVNHRPQSEMGGG